MNTNGTVIVIDASSRDMEMYSAAVSVLQDGRIVLRKGAESPLRRPSREGRGDAEDYGGDVIMTTLSDCFEIGLDEETITNAKAFGEFGFHENKDEIRKRFARWGGDMTTVHADEDTAKRNASAAFRAVCTKWGRAGYFFRNYPLVDGRIVRKEGTWADEGGNSTAFYFVDLRRRAEV